MFQAILFAVFAVVFLFTSAKMRLKRMVLWLFSISVLIHAAGLSQRGRYDWVEYVLIVNGIALLILIGYMSFKIYTKFIKNHRSYSR